MFKSRPHISGNTTKRQHGANELDFAAACPALPLTTVDWTERWCTFPTNSEENVKKIYEFAVRNDDVFVVTFPKSGTTWLQEATWLLAHDLDFSTAIAEELGNRSPYLGLSAILTKLPYNCLEFAQGLKSPRVLKIHFPLNLIPKQIWEKKAKIAYCGRNPKDTVVSFYHFLRGTGAWKGNNINEFVEDFINNDIRYTPYWDHLMGFWQLRHEENIFFTTYEELKKDLAGVIVKLNQFLNKPELSKENIQKLVEHLSFDSMKANTSVDVLYRVKQHNLLNLQPDVEFYRRGIVGSYKDELSVDIQNQMDEWIEKNLKKYDIQLEDIFGEI